jgi:hypothetical protein
VSGIMDESELPFPALMLIQRIIRKFFAILKSLLHPEDYNLHDSPFTPLLFMYKDGYKVDCFFEYPSR